MHWPISDYRSVSQYAATANTDNRH